MPAQPQLPSNPKAALEQPAQSPRPSRLWLWFVAAFVIQIGAWTTWFAIAGQHRVAEVPLATVPDR